MRGNNRVAGWVMTFGLLTSPAIGVDQPEIGGVEGAFLGWGAGARALGMGRAFVAMADDASAGFWNPAGLARLEQEELLGLYASLWEGTTYHFLSYAFPTLTMGSFGISGTLLSSTGGERRDNLNNLLDGLFSQTKLGTAASYAWEWSGFLRLGVSLKYIDRWMEGWHSGLFGGDVGIMISPLSWITVGASAQNLVTSRYNTSDDLPLHSQAGIALRMINGMVVLAGDIESDGQWHVGMELKPLSPLVLRLGSVGWESSAGVGIAWNNLALDYSGALHRELGFSHRVAMNVKFGDLIHQKRLQLAEQHFDQAQEAIQRGETPRAQELLNEVMKLDPRHPVADFLNSQFRHK